MSLAEKLVSLRKQKGLTQMDLAEQLDVSRQAISRWEVGAAVPSTDNLKVLGDLYGVPIDYLLNDNVEDPNRSSDGNNLEQGEQGKLKKRAQSKGIVLWTLIIIIFMAAVAGVAKIRRQERDQSVPIENMTVDDGDNYSEVTFPFE